MKILATDMDRTLLPNGHWAADPGAIDLFNRLTREHGVRPADGGGGGSSFTSSSRPRNMLAGACWLSARASVW